MTQRDTTPEDVESRVVRETNGYHKILQNKGQVRHKEIKLFLCALCGEPRNPQLDIILSHSDCLKEGQEVMILLKDKSNRCKGFTKHMIITMYI